MRLKLRTWGAGYTTDPREVTVEFVKVAHPYSTQKPNAAYDVVVDGTKVGNIHRVIESTDTKIAGTRLRRAGKGRLAWAWRTVGGEHNAPGLYCHNRAYAVTKMLGYDDYTEVRD